MVITPKEARELTEEEKAILNDLEQIIDKTIRGKLDESSTKINLRISCNDLHNYEERSGYDNPRILKPLSQKYLNAGWISMKITFTYNHHEGNERYLKVELKAPRK